MTEREQTSARLGGALTWALSVLTITAAAFSVVYAVRLVWLCHTALPSGDQWDELVTGRTLTWRWLFSQHNEHRILFPRLVFVADAWLLRERNVFDLAANLAVQAGTTILLIGLGWRLCLSGRPGKWVIASTILALQFSALQWENLTSPFQVPFFLVCFAALASVAVLAQSKAGPRPLAAVILLEGLAVFSMASGVVVPMVVLLLAIWRRRPVRQIVVLGIALTVLLTAYLWGYVAPDKTTDPLAALGDPMALAAYVLNEIGAFPMMASGHNNLWIQIASGTFGLLLLGGLCLTRRRGQTSASQAEDALLTVALFVVGMCVLTALGRVRFGLDQATSGRYLTAVLLFWTSIVLLAVSRLRGRLRSAGFVGLACLTLTMSILQPRLGSPAVRLARRFDAAIPAVLVPNGDLDLLARLYPRPETIAARLPSLQAAGASIFGEPWAGWLGHPFPGSAPTAALKACSGGSPTFIAVSDGQHSGWRVIGRIGEPDGAVMRVVFLDTEARVVGLGVTGLDARAVDDSPSIHRGRHDDWIGETTALDPHAVGVYGLDAQDRILCSLGVPS